MCNNPALCAEATLQPLRRFPATLDAVVIFSDILIVPQAMGLEVRMEPGPVFPAPLAGPADLARLTLRPDPATAFAPLFEGITRTRRLAAAPPAEGGCGKAVPVIGFCGAPWTLMSYMVAAGGREGPPAAAAAAGAAKKEGPERTRAWLYEHPDASHALLRALTEVCVDLLVGAWRAGASVLQVFESGAGDLPPPLFDAFSLPYLRAVAAGVRARVPPPEAGGPLLIAFPRAQHCAAALEGLVAPPRAASAFDAISLDWGWAPGEAAARVAAASAAAGRPGPLPLQGNLDPALLFAPRPAIFAAVRGMLQGFGAATPLVANLGHGMLPGHTPPALGDFFQAVALISARLRGGGGGAPLGDEELAAMEEGGRGSAEGRGDGAAQVAAALAVAAGEGCAPPPPAAAAAGR